MDEIGRSANPPRREHDVGTAWTPDRQHALAKTRRRASLQVDEPDRRLRPRRVGGHVSLVRGDGGKLYVDGYLVDTAIEDIAAPATLAAAPAGRGGGAGGGPGGVNVQVTPVARGLWRITGGTMVIEFADHMTLFEVGGGAERVAAVIKAARQIVPSKPVTEVIVSHHHFDHTAGLRQAVAEGLRVISRRDNGVIFREMTSRPTPNFPDALGRNPKPLEFIPVDDHLQLRDATMTVDIYHVIANNHMADEVFAYIPEHKAMIEAISPLRLKIFSGGATAGSTTSTTGSSTCS